MVEEKGVPVQEDWSMAPDEDRVRFSLSEVTPLWNRESKVKHTPDTDKHAYTNYVRMSVYLKLLLPAAGLNL